jgi:hypothetical protein
MFLPSLYEVPNTPLTPTTSEYTMLTIMVILTVIFFFTIHLFYKNRQKPIHKENYIQNYSFPNQIKKAFMQKIAPSHFVNFKRLNKP